MKKFYSVYAVVLVCTFAFATWRGISFTQALTGQWSPKGRQVYHK